MNEEMLVLPEWPHAFGVPENSGLIRSCPEDFVVEEIPRIQPDGEGSHLWLWIEKRAANTDWVASELAKVAACPRRDVGYAGLKDRHAITRQWFSVPIGEDTVARIAAAEIPDVGILARIKHGRKLKRGTLSGNFFHIKIKELKGKSEVIHERLASVRELGVPNYFGPQRFGHGGRNVKQGLDLLQRRARLARNKKSIYLSAMRSFLFNQVLAERVREGNWNTIMEGELAMLDGTHSVFPVENIDAEIEDRCQHLDIHPTGPMPGEDGKQPSGSVALLEREVLQSWPELTEVLYAQRVQASRRALRVLPAELDWKIGEGSLELAFNLPPGAYATTLLREVLLGVDNH